jgi:sugar phosphate isomerase/epimerase
MNHALSTHLFVNHRLTTALLDRIWAAGIPSVEIFCARQHFDYRDAGQVRELGHWFRDSQMTLHSVHAPMYNDDVWGRSGPSAVVAITEPEKRKRISSVDEIKRAIELAETVPFRYLVQHIGVAGEEYDARKVDAAFTALEEITVFARQRGVEVLLENIPNALSSAERLELFNTQTHLNLNYCFDLGHAHMNEGIPAAFGLMQNRIRSTHIHDNNGIEDQHLFPLASKGGDSIDWRKAMSLLRLRPDQYPLVLELREAAEISSPLNVVRDIFERLEILPAPEQRE